MVTKGSRCFTVGLVCVLGWALVGAAAVAEESLPRQLRERLPLDYLKIDMEQRHYEIAIPKLFHDWHLRWIEHHEADARALYGDAYVDQALSRWPADTGFDADGALSLRATVDTNRNSAATFTPEPTDYQGEIQVVVNPSNVNQIVSAANTWDGMGGTCLAGIQAIFYSGDGGATWGYTCAPDHNDFALGS